jgi:tetratricopeptide (TPR) repeat protein
MHEMKRTLSVLGILSAVSLTAQSGEKPVTLYPGMGTWSHAIATHNPQAQKFFDQGLSLLYGFNRPEAQRSFQKATELDPQAPMAQWGLAMAWGPYVNMDDDPTYDIKKSCEAVDKGLAIAGINSIERDWLEAAKTRCPDFADPARYIKAMHELAARYPDDLDAQTLYADALMTATRWHWYSNDGRPAEGQAEAERTLEAVLRRNPLHPGANHLYIHAVESSPTPERAIASSQRLMGIVPGGGHMVHMPGHIWLVLGDYNTAADVNERAAEVDRKYFAQTGMMSSYYMYYLHNLDFIRYARAMQGRVAQGRRAEQAMIAAAEPMLKTMPEMAGMVYVPVVSSQLRLNRWDEVLAAPKPVAADASSQSMWHFARALSFAMKGRVSDAKAEREEFNKVRSTIDAKMNMGQNKASAVFEVAAAILDARLAATPAESVTLFRKAVETQDALVYDEPPAWYYPVRESLGAALMRAGDAPGAEAMFREGVRRSPNNGRMLFGLMESLKAQNKAAAAAMVQKELEVAWKGADLKLKIEEL